MPWPQSKSFAFTIIDDTDNATVENIRPVYDYLIQKGLNAIKNRLLEQKKPETVSLCYTNTLDLRWHTNRGFKKNQHGH